MGDWLKRRKARKARTKSNRGDLKAMVDKAKDAPDKTVDFDYEDTADVLDLALEEVRRSSKEGLEKVEAATTTLKEVPKLIAESIVPPKKATG